MMLGGRKKEFSVMASRISSGTLQSLSVSTKQSYTVGKWLFGDTVPLSHNATAQSEDFTFSGVGPHRLYSHYFNGGKNEFGVVLRKRPGSLQHNP